MQGQRQGKGLTFGQLADMVSGAVLSQAMDESSKAMIRAMGEEACLHQWDEYCSRAAGMIDAEHPDWTDVETSQQVSNRHASVLHHAMGIISE